jgi:shikimate dehydrogenase
MHITGKTQIYGLIGYPVEHTFSPLMHNAAFESLNINAVYLPFGVKPKDLKSVICCMKSLGVHGINVTIPHKEKVLRYLDELDKEASLIGAVNTIVNKNNRFKGFNTDGMGFVSSLEKEFGILPRGKRFFIIGAGGASRAISFSLAINGARRIVFIDDVEEKAIRLASSLSRKTSCEAIAIRKDKNAICELLLNSEVLINATPCGMKTTDPKVIDPKFLRKDLFVYDIIYNPSMTKLLKDAKNKGARISNGVGMLLNQGAISFSLWTGKKAPLRVMKEALEKAL